MIAFILMVVGIHQIGTIPGYSARQIKAVKARSNFGEVTSGFPVCTKFRPEDSGLRWLVVIVFWTLRETHPLRNEFVLQTVRSEPGYTSLEQ